MARGTHPWIVVLIVSLAAVSGCARSPEAKKAQHLERGDRYFAKEQYRDALLHYRGALRIEPTNLHATRQLGLSHYHLGEYVQAYSGLTRARDMEPENRTVRLKLGTIYALAQDPDKAREEALFVLEKEPKNREALAILAGAAQTPKDVDAAVQRLEAVREEFRGHAQIHLALGILYGRKGNAAAAERAFKDAVAADPKSPETRITLGNFYLGRRDPEQAEREFKMAAELAPHGSWARIKLADFYFRAGKAEEGRRLLEETTSKAPDFWPAWRRLAEIAFDERRYDDSIKALEVVLKKNPDDVSGRLLRGRIHLAKNEFPQAIQAFQEVLRQEPSLVQARHELAVAYLQSGNPQQARAELKLATTADPSAIEPPLRLAELDIQAGAIQPAIEALQRLVSKHPAEVRAYVLLGRAYLIKNDPRSATEVYRRITAVAPRDPRGPYLVGVALRAQGKTADARKEFEASLALRPDYPGPLVQIVGMALAEKRVDLAVDRVKKQIALVPGSAPFHYLLGRAYEANRETKLAEQTYVKALELEPGLMEAYIDLARLYAGGGQLDLALAKLEDAPKSAVTHTLIGSLHQQRGDIPKAQSAYEKALALNPRFIPAANNLAVLYSEHGGDQAKEKALQLAQLAREAAPEEPHIADTLGWILYKRGVYHRSLALLQESADKLAGNPEVQYHLGMAAQKAGDLTIARKALTTAVGSPGAFAGKDEARLALDGLK